MSASDIPEHELLLAGFPCQAFSQAGLKQGFQDTRNYDSKIGTNKGSLTPGPRIHGASVLWVTPNHSLFGGRRD